MTKIKELAERIIDEVEDAKEYAEKYVESKAAKDTEWARRYKEMADDELKHAKYLHELAVSEIEAVDKALPTFAAMSTMTSEWESSHKSYVETAAFVKQMLEL